MYICVSKPKPYNLQWPRITGRTTAFARNVMAAAAILTATLLHTLGTVMIWRTCVATLLTPISFGALTFTGGRVAGGIIQAVALLAAITSPVTRWTICIGIIVRLFMCIKKRILLFCFRCFWLST